MHAFITEIKDEQYYLTKLEFTLSTNNKIIIELFEIIKIVKLIIL